MEPVPLDVSSIDFKTYSAIEKILSHTLIMTLNFKILISLM